MTHFQPSTVVHTLLRHPAHSTPAASQLSLERSNRSILAQSGPYLQRNLIKIAKAMANQDEQMNGLMRDFQAAAAGSKSDTDDDVSPNETALLQFSRDFILAVNTRQFDMALGLENRDGSSAALGVSLNFTARLASSPNISSWNEYVESFQSEATRWPEYCLTVISSAVSLGDVQDKAYVFLLIEETGKPPGMRTVAGSRLEWLKVGSRWMLSKHLMCRGVEMVPMHGE